MADQKKWFKVWTSLLVDMDHVSNDDLGAWVRLGCRVALVGDSGKVRFEHGWEHLASFLKCSIPDAQDTLKRFRGIVIEEGKTIHDELFVSFTKWYEYQEDSTYKERLKRTRDKRRGEEKREEQIRREDMPAWIKIELWESFQEVRRGLKAKMTKRAERLIIGELEKLKAKGNDPNKVLEQSIRNAWKDVYPLKSKDNGHSEIDHGKNKFAGWSEFKPRTPLKDPIPIGKVLEELKLPMRQEA